MLKLNNQKTEAVNYINSGLSICGRCFRFISELLKTQGIAQPSSLVRPFFSHVVNLSQIRLYTASSPAKVVAAILVFSELNYCKSLKQFAINADKSPSDSSEYCC